VCDTESCVFEYEIGVVVVVVVGQERTPELVQEDGVVCGETGIKEVTWEDQAQVEVDVAEDVLGRGVLEAKLGLVAPLVLDSPEGDKEVVVAKPVVLAGGELKPGGFPVQQDVQGAGGCGIGDLESDGEGVLPVRLDGLGDVESKPPDDIADPLNPGGTPGLWIVHSAEVVGPGNHGECRLC